MIFKAKDIALLKFVLSDAGFATARARRDMEQRVVRALVLCGDQLYRELGVCRFRRRGLVARRLCNDHLPASPTRRPAGRGFAGITNGTAVAGFDPRMTVMAHG